MQNPSPETALDQLAQAFAQWRATKPTRISPIPEALLDQAQQLTQALPVTRVLKRLGLSSAQLKQRRRSGAASSVEFCKMEPMHPLPCVPDPTPMLPPETPLTLRLNHGQTLTLTGLPGPQLASLIAALLER